jgi:hypothetical protein
MTDWVFVCEVCRSVGRGSSDYAARQDVAHKLDCPRRHDIKRAEKARDTQPLTDIILTRLAAGEREYGDASSKREPVELVREMREEVADVIGWCHQLDRSLERRDRQTIMDTELGDELRQRCSQLWRLLARIEERVK